jgi:PST family polysaccharide transporter
MAGITPEPPVELDASPPAAGQLAAQRRGIRLRGRSLRAHTARGTLINGTFLVAVNSLGLLRGFLLAGFLSAGDYGIWGLLAVAVGGLYWFKQVGISEKSVQQDEADQELAFQKAFTLEVIVNVFFMALMAALIPVVALAYGEPRIVAPAYVLLLSLPAVALQSPLWAHYRSMDFVRQRLLQSYEPVLGFAAMIALAALGFGYWSLVVGALVGSWSSAIAAVVSSPYRLRLRYDRGTLREYVGFSAPLFVGSLTRFLSIQSYLLVGTRHLGIAAVGFITLASQISQYTDRVDRIVADTLYPAICAVRDRLDLLQESFVKSNRLALMWGAPMGVGLALFASDLITYGIGDHWRGAENLFIAFGLIAAISQLAYNWDDYLRAMARTRPIAAWGVINLVAALGVTMPLLLWKGLDGYALGMGLAALVSLAARVWFLREVFPSFAIVRHTMRAFLPTLPAAMVVLVARAVEPANRSLGVALAELAAYGLTVLAATFTSERPLLREAIDYVRPRAATS